MHVNFSDAVLPCRKGDTVYTIDIIPGKYGARCVVRPCTVKAVSQTEIDYGEGSMPIECIGREIFFSKRYAEDCRESLQEMADSDYNELENDRVCMEMYRDGYGFFGDKEVYGDYGSEVGMPEYMAVELESSLYPKPQEAGTEAVESGRNPALLQEEGNGAKTEPVETDGRHEKPVEQEQERSFGQNIMRRIRRGR